MKNKKHLFEQKKLQLDNTGSGRNLNYAPPRQRGGYLLLIKLPPNFPNL